ncbi:GNAT family N-acetyltransferase [Pseudalkalibacillus berkeleyi]|uniref:GNAT family N-acetyltransferase n=1 Tax=Pseudalkalibacillus berkeleyi TaxID=1069813 RepID=A0ABS9H2E5_9BACL|nr:GNAT family N-acetyltransferase [Pseudalkalibacillus berkeleyi]MCF6139059.1 GNAT family N-acetyltransferase [Pseudalkalibacillus berkeleyi]
MIKEMELEHLHSDMLKGFNRTQVTTNVWYKSKEGYQIKEDYFVDQWDDAQKEKVIADLKRCLKHNGAVFCAMKGAQLVGFANIEGRRFGSRNQYIELPYIHVSDEYRGYGIGKKLFKKCTDKAKEWGAEKLYIGAHPAIETQHFYQSVGCTYAEEINPEIYEREPLDIQLEYEL